MTAGIRDLTGGGQNFGEFDQLVRREVHFGGEGVQMFHGRLEELLGARVWGEIEGPKGRLGDVGGGYFVGGNRMHKRAIVVESYRRVGVWAYQRK